MKYSIQIKRSNQLLWHDYGFESDDFDNCKQVAWNQMMRDNTVAKVQVSINAFLFGKPVWRATKVRMPSGTYAIFTDWL